MKLLNKIKAWWRRQTETTCSDCGHTYPSTVGKCYVCRIDLMLIERAERQYHIAQREFEVWHLYGGEEAEHARESLRRCASRLQSVIAEREKKLATSKEANP